MLGVWVSGRVEGGVRCEVWPPTRTHKHPHCAGCQREMSSVADLLSSDDLTSSAENSDAGPSLLSSAQKRRHAARSERRRHRMTRQMAQQGGMDKQQQQQGAGEPSSADTMQAELAKQALNRKKQQYLERAKKAYAAKKQHEAEQRCV